MVDKNAVATVGILRKIFGIGLQYDGHTGPGEIHIGGIGRYFQLRHGLLHLLADGITEVFGEHALSFITFPVHAAIHAFEVEANDKALLLQLLLDIGKRIEVIEVAECLQENGVSGTQSSAFTTVNAQPLRVI